MIKPKINMLYWIFKYGTNSICFKCFLSHTSCVYTCRFFFFTSHDHIPNFSVFLSVMIRTEHFFFLFVCFAEQINKHIMKSCIQSTASITVMQSDA